jgi:hypothetical protein
MLLAADILYVGVRNHGVLSLAERGLHAYAFDAVTAGLEEMGLVAAGGARALGALRFAKCLYRNGEVSRGDAARDVVEAALAVLPQTFFPASVRALDPRRIIAAPAPAGCSAYVVLRDLERRYVALQALGHDHAADEDLARLKRWIANPRAYASISGRLAPSLQGLVTRLARGGLNSRRAVAG